MVRLSFLVCFCAMGFSGLAQPYQPGHFYTPDWKQVKGKIKFSTIQSGHLSGKSSVPGWIKFKPENDQKSIDVNANEMRGFVMGIDSFVVLKNIPVSPQDHFKRDFVKVEAIGDLNLYIHYSLVPSGRFGSTTKQVYILQRKGSKKLTSFYNRYQREQFLNLISDDPPLVAEVREDWQWLNKVPQFIKRYNSRGANLNAKK